jgi:hypothetical protein
VQLPKKIIDAADVIFLVANEGPDELAILQSSNPTNILFTVQPGDSAVSRRADVWIYSSGTAVGNLQVTQFRV